MTDRGKQKYWENKPVPVPLCPIRISHGLTCDRTRQLVQSVSVIKTSQLMLYREIIAVCSQIHTKHVNTLCGQNVEFLNVKLAVHIVTTGPLLPCRRSVQSQTAHRGGLEFYPSSPRVVFVVNKVTFLSEYFGFPHQSSFYHCCIFICSITRPHLTHCTSPATTRFSAGLPP